MNRLSVATFSVAFALIAGAQNSFAEDDVNKAREALAKQDTDASQEKSLEEVFEATENKYSLIKEGDTSFNYGFSYSYVADQRLNVQIANGQIRAFDVNPSASHSFSNNFSVDYGFKNNLTLGTTVPFVVKYDTTDNIAGAGLGDISFNARWQPYVYVPGEMSKTVTGSFKTTTGDSPYKTISGRRLSTGSGYYSVSGGMSVSKVIDPVMLFGSYSLTYNLPVEDVNQVRDGSILEGVDPGYGFGFSGGFAYSLSYDVSLSMSFQGSYNDKTVYHFRTSGNNTNNKVVSRASMSGIMNFSLGVRVSPKTITNVGVGFGMTEDSPDILLSLSMPIDANGLKAKFLPAGA